MSWDACIVRIRGPIRPIADVANDDYLPLGSPDAVMAVVRAAFPSASWAASGLECVARDADTGVHLEFGFTGVASHHTITVSARGGGNPVPPLLALAAANDWVVIDAQDGEFIDPTHPSTDSRSSFRSLVGHVTRGNPGNR